MDHLNKKRPTLSRFATLRAISNLFSFFYTPCIVEKEQFPSNPYIYHLSLRVTTIFRFLSLYSRWKKTCHEPVRTPFQAVENSTEKRFAAHIVQCCQSGADLGFFVRKGWTIRYPRRGGSQIQKKFMQGIELEKKIPASAWRKKKYSCENM